MDSRLRPSYVYATRAKPVCSPVTADGFGSFGVLC